MMTKYENRVSRSHLNDKVSDAMFMFLADKNFKLENMDEVRGLASHVVNRLFDEIEQCLIEGKSVLVTGFGTFNVKERKGHPVPIGTIGYMDSYKHIKFTPSKHLAHAVRHEKRNP